jgi:dTDP-4-dehydrorhamnose reductase
MKRAVVESLDTLPYIRLNNYYFEKTSEIVYLGGPMKILILGATGMLGHKLVQILSGFFDTTGSVRKNVNHNTGSQILKGFNLMGNVNAFESKSVELVINKVHPDVVINCIGIVKQLKEANDPIKSITINSLFPHQLHQLCHEKNIRLIHYSTDCVFSGARGNYSETDFPDADDLYGRSKLLGEVTGPGCLTLRTSLIGRELESSHGLIEWFLSQKGKTVKGYKNAIFSGLTTNAHVQILREIITEYPYLEGLYHLSADPISKYDLLTFVNEKYHLDINIEPDYSEVSDRSLNSSKFRSATDIIIHSWPEMIDEMFNDPTPYDHMREYHAYR